MKLKQIIIYVITCVVTFLIVLLAMYLYNEYQAKKLVKDFDKVFASDKKQVIFYARKTCYFCQLEKPILKEIAADYDLDYLNIDGDLLSEKQKEHIIDALGTDGSTPVTAIVKNKKVLNIHVGYLDGKEYVDFFKDAGMLPDDAIYKPEKNISFIDYDGFLNFDKGILVLGATASSSSIDIRASLNDIASEYKTDINYLNLSTLTKDEYYELIEILKSYNVNKLKITDEGSLIVPLIYIIDEKEIKGIIKDTEKDQIIKELKNNNIIK